jgi:uncharacterized membrane protein YbhN (UPF0104 family)
MIFQVGVIGPKIRKVSLNEFVGHLWKNLDMSFNSNSNRKHNNKFHTLLILLITISFTSFLVYYLYANADKYFELLKISVINVVALFLLALTFPFLNGLINVYLFRSLGAQMSIREGFFLAGSSSLANQLPLPGGIVARGIYLKHRHGISYAAYISAVLAVFVGMLAVNGVIGIIVLLYLFVLKQEIASLFLVIGFSVMALSGGVFLLPVLNLQFPYIIWKRVNQALQGWVIISHDRSLLFRILHLETWAIFLLAARYWVAFHMLSQDVSVSHVLLMSAATILTQLISLAPGGLGVREIIVGSVASALGFDITVTIAAIELDRIVSTFTILLIGWISTVILGKQLSSDDVVIDAEQQQSL